MKDAKIWDNKWLVNKKKIKIFENSSWLTERTPSFRGIAWRAWESESTPVKKGIVTFVAFYSVVRMCRKAPRLRRGL